MTKPDDPRPGMRSRAGAAVVCLLAQAACAGAALRNDVAQARLQTEQLAAQQERVREALRAAFPEAGDLDFRQGYALHHRGRHEEAERVLRGYLRSGPSPALAAEARTWIGETLYARGRHRDALVEWRAAAALLHDDVRRARLLHRMAAAHEALGESEQARHLLLEVIRLYPDTDVAGQARAGLDLH